MPLIGPNGGSGFSTSRSIADLREQINSLSRQLTTGKKAATISELGNSVARTVDLRSRLSRLSVYDDAIQSANSDLQTIANGINSFSKTSGQILTNTLSLATTPDSTNRSTVKTDLRRQFTELVDFLNIDSNGNYVFGGKNVGSESVLDATTILDGSGTKAGLTQYISERQAADLGSNNQGRLQLSNSSTTISLAETVAGSVFGFTLKGVTSQDANIVANGPSGTPPQVSFIVNAQPESNAILTLTLGLPDGSTQDVTLTATGGSGTNSFAIGTTAANTASNIATALQSALVTTGKVQLFAASAKAAALDFFKGSTTNPPKRVVGPPFDSATAFTAGTAANTILWYQGTDDTNDSRNDRVTKIDERVSIGVGVRANEAGFVEALAGTALLAVTNFSTTDETLAKEQFIDLRDRARESLTQSKTDVTNTNVSVLMVQKSAKSRGDDQKAQKTVFETAIATIEDAPLDQTAVSLTSVQTQLQALYQLTAKLQSLSLANYL
ncbi:MAG: hypothetical protein EBT35_00555 [Alphaproteobacteria bacterium]|nr:hypothetical protein [Alphaproteobacteria bacterium]